MSALAAFERRLSKSRLYVELATTIDDIRASQALRYQVFGEEGGATLHTADDRLDTDHFDRYCQHLLVRDGHSGQVVGSTRLLLANQARKAGGFYSQGGSIWPRCSPCPVAGWGSGTAVSIRTTAVVPRSRCSGQAWRHSSAATGSTCCSAAPASR